MTKQSVFSSPDFKMYADTNEHFDNSESKMETDTKAININNIPENAKPFLKNDVHELTTESNENYGLILSEEKGKTKQENCVIANESHIYLNGSNVIDNTLSDEGSDTDCEYLSSEVYHYIIKDESPIKNSVPSSPKEKVDLKIIKDESPIKNTAPSSPKEKVGLKIIKDESPIKNTAPSSPKEKVGLKIIKEETPIKNTAPSILKEKVDLKTIKKESPIKNTAPSILKEILKGKVDAKRKRKNSLTDSWEGQNVQMAATETPKKKVRNRRKNTPKKKNSSSEKSSMIDSSSQTTEVLAEFDYDAHVGIPFENISNVERECQQDRDDSKTDRGLKTNKSRRTGAVDDLDIKVEIDVDSAVVVMNKNTKFNSRMKPDTSTFRHRCSICLEVFQWPYQLKRHTDIKHEGKYPHYCNICNKPFERISGLKDHMLVHTEDRPFECEICNKPFKMKGNLKKHVREFHMDNPLNFQCEYCAKVFKSKEKLMSHFVVHNEEKLYECEVCHKRFHRKNNLIEHRIIHTTDKNFECPECGQSFNRKYALKIHSRNHMEVKPYRCELCPSSFNQLHALKNHIRRHTGEKPYKCTMCDRSFAQQSTLQVHTRRHTGEKNYACGICDQSFVIKRRLTEHFRLHTGEKPYQCELCPFKATISSGLKGHMKTHMRQLQRQVEKESSDIVNGELLTMIQTGKVECGNELKSENMNGDERYVKESIEEIAKQISLTHGEGLKEIIGQGIPSVLPAVMKAISERMTSPEELSEVGLAMNGDTGLSETGNEGIEDLMGASIDNVANANEADGADLLVIEPLTE